jgi:hypothetical protein
MVSNLTFSQSNYPLKTIIKGDSVVILRKEQADEINVIFDRQKKEIADLKKKIEELNEIEITKDSVINSLLEKEVIYSPIAKRLDLIENWLYWASVQGSWIYFSYEDSTMYRVNLSDYKVRKDDKKGDLFFYWCEEEIDLSESPKLNWQNEVIRSRRPKIEVVPIIH